MIEILLKNKEIVKVKSIQELFNRNLDFNMMQCVDYTDQELSWMEERFGVDFSIMKHHEDIEISSHFLANEKQISLPTLVAGIYGMNFEYIPELKTTLGYPLTLVGMLLAAALPYAYFKRKKWL